MDLSTFHSDMQFLRNATVGIRGMEWPTFLQVHRFILYIENALIQEYTYSTLEDEM